MTNEEMMECCADDCTVFAPESDLGLCLVCGAHMCGKHDCDCPIDPADLAEWNATANEAESTMTRV
jgi:hypothetical protein